MRKIVLFIICAVTFHQLPAQETLPDRLLIHVTNPQQTALSNSTVELLRGKDSVLLRTNITDTAGRAFFEKLVPGNYRFRITCVNYTTLYTAIFTIRAEERGLVLPAFILQPAGTQLKAVTVEAKKPFIQQLPDKIVVNVEAAITNAGSTALEVLEKSPGVTVDRNGGIQLNGRAGVLILIDNKPAYLSGTDLVNLLSGMSATQLEQIELIANPSSRYDAAGNAGIINLKMKKNRQRGFNGSFSTSYGQGQYPKNNTSLVLNYRNGHMNYFLTYSLNANKNFTDLYALRTYYKEDGKTVDALLEQPTLLTGTAYTNTLRTGFDYAVTKKTTVGLSLTGILVRRNGDGFATAQWKNAGGATDSVVNTSSTSSNSMNNGGINVNLRHTINKQQELSADVDVLHYKLGNEQAFENNLQSVGGYNEALQGDLPGTLRIYSAKADYTLRTRGNTKWETGWKSAHVKNDNRADFFYSDGGTWQPDLNKTNHFIYAETIHALYGNVEKQLRKWTLQGGLRYEHTHYDGHQLGNAARKDSAFGRTYSGLFPSGLISYKADSANQFTLTAGRRIDRPGFQKLNPFVFVINKYTNQQGNPFFRPQYTWNVELAHAYKDVFMTRVSYNVTKDYFSQIFLSDTSGNIIYTEGNLGKMQNLGMMVNAQLPLFKWWSFTTQVTLNHKRIEGIIDQPYKSTITQASFNLNNQFRFSKGWSAELSGFYTTRSQQDLQEVLDPTGQVSAGVAKQVLHNKGTLRAAVRDIFYSQRMQGYTTFQQSGEFFKLMRDSRVATIAFTYRFGKAAKVPAKRTSGASDEIQRVGAGG